MDASWPLMMNVVLGAMALTFVACGAALVIAACRC